MKLEKGIASNPDENREIIEIELFSNWMMTNDYWRLFLETGNILSWIDFNSVDKLLVHIIQPNRLHYLGRFDSKAMMLKTVVRDLTKNQMIKYVKENTQVNNALILDYDELDLTNNFDDI